MQSPDSDSPDEFLLPDYTAVPAHPGMATEFLYDEVCYCRHCVFTSHERERMEVHLKGSHKIEEWQVKQGRDFVWGRDLIKERLDREFAAGLAAERFAKQLDALGGADDFVFEAGGDA